MSLFGTVTGVLMVGGGSSGQAQLIGADWRGIGQNPLESLPNPFASRGSPSMGTYEWRKQNESAAVQ